MDQHPYILITQKVPEPTYLLLKKVGRLDANSQEGQIWSAEELRERAPGHDYLFCLLTDTIDEQLLEACASATPRLKLVANTAILISILISSVFCNMSDRILK